MPGAVHYEEFSKNTIPILLYAKTSYAKVSYSENVQEEERLSNPSPRESAHDLVATPSPSASRPKCELIPAADLVPLSSVHGAS